MLLTSLGSPAPFTGVAGSVEPDYPAECIDALYREMQAGRRKLLVEMAAYAVFVLNAKPGLRHGLRAEDSGKPPRHHANDALTLVQREEINATRPGRQSVEVAFTVSDLHLLELRDQCNDDGVDLTRRLTCRARRLSVTGPCGL